MWPHLSAQGGPTHTAASPTGWNPTASTQRHHHYKASLCPFSFSALHTCSPLLKLTYICSNTSGISLFKLGKNHPSHTHTHRASLIFWRRKQRWRLQFFKMVDSFWAWLVQQPSSQQLSWTNGASRTGRGTWWHRCTTTRVCGGTVRPLPRGWPSVVHSTASWGSQVGRGSYIWMCRVSAVTGIDKQVFVHCCSNN